LKTNVAAGLATIGGVAEPTLKQINQWHHNKVKRFNIHQVKTHFKYG
jgi:hypothetical protein